MNKNKILYINYLIHLHNPDYLIICETWLDEKPTMIDKRYEIHQTWFWKHQGVCIIARSGSVSKMYINDEPYLICTQVRNGKSISFVIGAYFKESLKTKILDQLKHLLNRIRKTFVNPSIFIYGDFNIDKKFNINLIEDTLKLKIDQRNRDLITRAQIFKGKEIVSTLDIFLTTESLESIQTLDKNLSDHFPILIHTKLSSNESRKIKTIKLIKRNYTDNSTIKQIMENKHWPTITEPLKTKQLLQQNMIFRPTIKLQNNANKIFSQKWDWNLKEMNLKTLWNESFREYVRNLDLWRTKDSAKFYKIIQSIIKYKGRGKLVKGINKDGIIIYGKFRDKYVKEYYQKAFNDNVTIGVIKNNGTFDYTIKINEAIERLATNKAVGWDYIPGELYKIVDKSEEMKLRLKEHFTRYVMTGYVPKYFMNAKLILLSKDDSETPTIQKTRPISILPTITKLFESSILHNFEKITQSPIFSKNQRGFIRGKSTHNNIEDIIQIAKELQIKRKLGTTKIATIIFFDFEKAYDNVPRNILIEKLQKYNLPWNITKIVDNMLSKFSLKYNEEIMQTYKGLVQGSVLSPILFNLFINDLLLTYEVNGITVRAYADDIACIWSSLAQTRKAIEIMRNWIIINRMTINPKKSGIIRILNRKGGWSQIKNWLQIVEVKSYRYLGITINQALRLDEHYQMLKSVEEKLKKRLILLKPSLLNTKSRLVVYKTILKSKMSYACEVILKNNDKYTKKWESMLYRLLKILFWIKTNVSKQKIFETLGLGNSKCTIAEYLTLKTIKLWMDWLFQRKPSKPNCQCNKIIDSYHVVNSWPKTAEWREIYNKKAQKQLKMNIWEAFDFRDKVDNKNILNLASLLNEATEELVNIYLGS